MGQLDATTKGFIESFHSQLKQMTLFELLGADSDADLTALRRAYHRRSKQIHPDRYYKRVDEQHRAMLERSFDVLVEHLGRRGAYAAHGGEISSVRVACLSAVLAGA